MPQSAFRIAAVLAWMGLIFYLSSQPELPYMPGLDLINWNDKIKHVAVYAILAALVWRALGGDGPNRRRFWLAVAISIVYGLTDEFHQRFVPNRCCDVGDLVADALGALAAAVIVSRSGGSPSPPNPGIRRKVGEKHAKEEGRGETIRGKGQEAGQSRRQP